LSTSCDLAVIAFRPHLYPIGSIPDDLMASKNVANALMMPSNCGRSVTPLTSSWHCIQLVESKLRNIFVDRLLRFCKDHFRPLRNFPEFLWKTLTVHPDPQGNIMMILCYWCKRPLYSRRQDATFCSNACRQANYRKKKTENRVFQKKRVKQSRKQRLHAKFSNPTIS